MTATVTEVRYPTFAHLVAGLHPEWAYVVGLGPTPEPPALPMPPEGSTVEEQHEWVTAQLAALHERNRQRDNAGAS